MDQNNTLLIVDDEKNILHSLNRLLRDEGYRILSATSGKEGLEILSREAVGVVVSDLMMPEMDGVEFLDKASSINPDAVQILLTGHASLDVAVNAINRLGLFCFVCKPFKTEVIKSDISRAFDKYHLVLENKCLHLLTKEQNKQLADLNETLEERVNIRTRLLEEAVDETITLLARIAETKDNRAEGHIYRIHSMVLDLCQAMELTDEESKRISQFSMIHDIGKVTIRDEVLRKSSPLADNEISELQYHTVAGEALLGVKPFYQTGRKIARNHHENWDGSGYPDGLAGEDIPLAARIVTVVDAFDALTKKSAGQGKSNVVEALKTIREFSGIKFDPKIVAVFTEMQINRLNQRKQAVQSEKMAVNS